MLDKSKSSVQDIARLARWQLNTVSCVGVMKPHFSIVPMRSLTAGNAKSFSNSAHAFCESA